MLPLLGAVVAAEEEQAPQVVLSPQADPQAVIEVRGLAPQILSGLRNLDADSPHWQRILAVFVGIKRDPNQPAMLGRYEVAQSTVRFIPRFPLQRGTKYEAILNVSALSPGAGRPIRQTFAIPTAKTAPTRVTAVYPSASRLPENLLKFYLHFSAPMSQGNSYRHLHLLKENGKEVDLPFLELPEELWNPAGTRLTVLFDPGRVKQGLKPREVAGPILVAGQRYTLVVDQDWRDAAGQTLQQPLRKEFLATKADTSQPNPADWKIHAPQAGTRESLSVRFREPLDHALLFRVLQLHDPHGIAVIGAIAVGEKERVWQFTPQRKWSPGCHTLSIAQTLEDNAGNSVGRPFEVTGKNQRPAAPSTAVVELAVKISPTRK